MHCPLNPAAANWENRITGFVGPFVNLKPLATEREHLRLVVRAQLEPADGLRSAPVGPGGPRDVAGHAPEQI